jgi:hypothetical protein
MKLRRRQADPTDATAVSTLVQTIFTEFVAAE